MYARVAKWEGAEADTIRSAADGIKADAASGPPEGLPAKGLLLLIDPDGGRSMAISLFATEEDARKAEATFASLREMPEAPATFISVDVCEIVGHAPA